MKIDSVRIENFRGFADETIHFRDYTCLVGPNGAGKSTILAALNVFFRQFKDSHTDLSKLTVDDFHHKNVELPIRITVTFGSLSDEAKEDLSHYVRDAKLIVSAVAKYDPNKERAEVQQFGSRPAMKEFVKYFDADKAGESASALKGIYQDLRAEYPALPDVRVKGDMVAALQAYEAEHPELCELIPSEDQFYGAIKGPNRLAQHLQWVFVPAVKHVAEESQESKTSGLGQLLTRTVRNRVDFAERVGKIQHDTREEYQKMLDDQQSVLDSLSDSLQQRLRSWSHPKATARILWTQDPEKSVKVEEPWAYIKLGERGFEAELARFGHGMQRSFMLTLLQELASIQEGIGPTLILAIEEPELYQHPPQARYLSELLRKLSTEESQVMVCSHSPLFIPGDDFESVRIVRDVGDPSASAVSALSYNELAGALGGAGQKTLKAEGMLAKLYPILDPAISEMFFCKALVLCEGIEDVAYMSSYIELTGRMGNYRRAGCHIVPVGGKSKLLKPAAIARKLGIPVFVVFDADTDETNEEKVKIHKLDNKQLLSLMSLEGESEWPEETLWRKDVTMWKTNIAKAVAEDIGDDWNGHVSRAEAQYAQPGGLRKNPLAIAWALDDAWSAGHKSDSLDRLAGAIVEFSNDPAEG